MSESLSQKMHQAALDQIAGRLQLSEETGEAGGAFLPLISQAPMVQGEIGQVRVFRAPAGSGVTKLVSCTIVVPPIGLDSHMLFAFADTETAVPHFTVDSVRTGEVYAFHLDLTPRLDLAVSLAYMDEVFMPLTERFKAHQETEGLSPAQLDPRQYAVMSPWMLVNRCTEDAFRASFDAVQAYCDHWLSVLENGVSDAALSESSPAQRADRDSRHRAILFSPEVDKVWGQITPLIGADNVQTIIGLLRDTRG